MNQDGSELDGLPADELLLAQALEAELWEGGQVPVPADAPESIRAEARALAGLARSVGAVGRHTLVRPEFRAAARERLMARVNADSPTQQIGVPIRLDVWARRRRGVLTWAMRSAAGVIALSMAGFATVNASASALPGDALYPVKQASETLAVQLASDDEARALALLRRADARLDETARLLQQGRTADAVQVAEQYEATVNAATTQLSTADTQPTTAKDVVEAQTFQAKLEEQQKRLRQVLDQAPESARPGLTTALAASSRGREQVTATGTATPGQAPTREPTRGATATAARVTLTAAPAPSDDVAKSDDDERERGRGQEKRELSAAPTAQAQRGGNDDRRGDRKDEKKDEKREDKESDDAPAQEQSVPPTVRVTPSPVRQEQSGQRQRSDEKEQPVQAPSQSSGDRGGSDRKDERRTPTATSVPQRPSSTPTVAPSRSDDGRQANGRSGDRGRDGQSDQDRERSDD